MSPRPALIAAACLAALAACATRDGAPTAADPAAPALGKATTVKDPTAEFLFATSDATLGVRGDGLYASGTNSVYRHGDCGVNSKIFATAEASNSGDAIMQTNNIQYRTRTCAAYPRKLTIVYDDGTTRTEQQTTAFMNVHNIHNDKFQMAEGETVQRGMVLDDARCGGLRWKPVLNDGTLTEAKLVNVTRVNERTWEVWTKPGAGEAKAYCVAEKRTYDIPVRFTIVSHGDLAFPSP
jgi:hypothetical protein